MTMVADDRAPDGGLAHMRRLIDASHRRSWDLLGSPDRASPRLVADGDALHALREAHPLAVVYDVLHDLLIDPVASAGMIVAITDPAGHLVWVEGERTALRRAEAMAFVPGADWSEEAVGTSAPGAAIAAGDSVQVVGEQHFSPAAHTWSCSAVPIRHPVTRDLLGVIDVTGGRDAVAPYALPLLRAAASAATAELRLREATRAADEGVPARSSARVGADARARDATPVTFVRLLGRDRAELVAPNGRRTELSPRHSEILLLLAAHPAGLHGPQLAALLYPDAASAVTLRAEIARLRAVLAELDPSIRLAAQPYRLEPALRTDVDDLLAAVNRGAHRHALRVYAGAPLPTSDAPGVADVRERTRSILREAVLEHGNVEAVMAMLALPEYDDDAEVNALALRLLPPRSPRRAAIVARLALLEG